jgi:hypothetical protein
MLLASGFWLMKAPRQEAAFGFLLRLEAAGWVLPGRAL